VCRLRRSSTLASGIPTAPAAIAEREPPVASLTKSPVFEDLETKVEDLKTNVHGAVSDKPSLETKVAERFFIVKSLTLQELEQSVVHGIWATQAHNEQILNKAFEESAQYFSIILMLTRHKAANHVYLIFSANKSGEYFGYARMASPITEDITHVVLQTGASASADEPRTIPTPATESAPPGRIFDDSTRGTLFWEAVLSDDEGIAGGMGLATQSTSLKADGSSNCTSPQVLGKLFKVEWLSTNRLPFCRTRGLRNPWNANKEVKVARDGTELETGVGKRLVQMLKWPGPALSGQISVMAISQRFISQMGPQMGGPGMVYY
jgi:hypothetical protein